MGLLSTNSNRRFVPRANPRMILRGLKFLRAPVMHSGFDQRNHAVRNQFAVDAKILAIHQHGQHRVWNSADAGLQYGAVLNQAGDVARDRDLEVGHHRLLKRAQRTRGLDQGVDIARRE